MHNAVPTYTTDMVDREVAQRFLVAVVPREACMLVLHSRAEGVTTSVWPLVACCMYWVCH
jgi:hypothetical protein